MEMKCADNHTNYSKESQFLQEQSEFNSQKKKQTEQPDLCKVEKLEILDI